MADADDVLSAEADDHFHDECGVFGIFGRQDAAAIVTLGLHALQHRGQEAAGIVSYRRHAVPRRTPCRPGRRHLHQAARSSTACTATAPSATRATPPPAAPALRNVQPLFAELADGGFAVAHNGNLTNAMTRAARRCRSSGAIFPSTSDTETILHLVATSSASATVNARCIDALRQVEGAFSLVGADGQEDDRLPRSARRPAAGARRSRRRLDPRLRDLRARHHRRALRARHRARRDGRHHRRGHREPVPVRAAEAALLHLRICLFRPARFHRSKAATSTRCASASAPSSRRESPVEADIVVPVPDSGTPAAIGFAQAAGIPFELGIIRNHYVGRTFIQPTDSIRHMGVKLKHNANRAHDRGQARGAGRRFDRARHHSARRSCRWCATPAPGKCTCASPAPPTTRLLLLRRRHAGEVEAARLAHVGRGDGRLHQGRFARLPVDRRPLPRRRRGRPRQRRSRNSATPASPATTRPACPTSKATTMCARCRCWRTTGRRP